MCTIQAFFAFLLVVISVLDEVYDESVGNDRRRAAETLRFEVHKQSRSFDLKFGNSFHVYGKVDTLRPRYAENQTNLHFLQHFQTSVQPGNR